MRITYTLEDLPTKVKRIKLYVTKESEIAKLPVDFSTLGMVYRVRDYLKEERINLTGYSL